MAIGQQVNIPVLACFVEYAASFRISAGLKELGIEKFMDCNDKK